MFLQMPWMDGWDEGHIVLEILSFRYTACSRGVGERASGANGFMEISTTFQRSQSCVYYKAVTHFVRMALFYKQTLLKNLSFLILI